MWLVVLALFVLGAFLLVGFVQVLDHHEADRRRWTHSVPTISSLPRPEVPRATARRRMS